MIGHVDTITSLRAIAEGRRAPARKYAAFQRSALIRVIGHGSRSKPVLTDTGRAKLAQAEASR
ncbi:hypothetical protein ASG40_12835 [Methylobacterium sp. Leaf399]|uniref:hypothetical protein n=1 Tax=unclassified Methylobacterium TaxID=2615210 RepID=UPI0006F68D73|nr:MULTISPECIES: hypothetical protein [unclassified Methylobacterium]KQP50809.1 hypothetical protein ASF39_11215 [Methylobacterium sp. Leaf108]KQT07789.1 hypothetical protein ASG40_12835 [Methylobacterium sp. Leaf399]